MAGEGPVGEGIGAFDLRLDAVRQVVEEIDAGQFFYLIDGAQIGHQGTTAGLVGHDKTDRGPAPRRITQEDLIESRRDGDLMRIAYRLIAGLYDRATGDVDVTILLGPAAGQFLQIFPVAGIQTVQLGTDIGHVERFTHGLLGPLHIGGRRHMAAVVAGTGIVAGGDGIALDRRIRLEMVGALLGPEGLLAGQFIRHPVGYQPTGVVADRIAHMGDYLLGLTIPHAGHLKRHNGRAGIGLRGKRLTTEDDKQAGSYQNNGHGQDSIKTIGFAHNRVQRYYYLRIYANFSTKFLHI